MYLCIYVYIYIMYVYIYVLILCMYVYIYIYIHMYENMYIYICIFTSQSIHKGCLIILDHSSSLKIITHQYESWYIYMFMYICTYIHIHSMWSCVDVYHYNSLYHYKRLKNIETVISRIDWTNLNEFERIVQVFVVPCWLRRAALKDFSLWAAWQSWFLRWRGFTDHQHPRHH